MALQGRVDALKAGAKPAITLEHAAEVPPVPDKPEAFSMKAFADSLPPIEQPNYFKVGFFNKKKAEQANGILRAKYEQEVEERAKEMALAKKKSEKLSMNTNVRASFARPLSTNSETWRLISSTKR